jgi:hypothetical protein
MAEFIIDTNVPLIAQGNSVFSADCEANCADFMDEVIAGRKTIVLDSAWHILGEYENNISTKGPISYLKIYLKWLFNNMANPQRVKLVNIHPDKDKVFEEVPQCISEIGFDKSDLKFVAVSVANRNLAPIVEAADSKWIGWEPALISEGISVAFLCRQELKLIYEKKMD